MVFRQIPEDNVADEGIEQESYARVYKTYDGLNIINILHIRDANQLSYHIL